MVDIPLTRCPDCWSKEGRDVWPHLAEECLLQMEELLKTEAGLLALLQMWDRVTDAMGLPAPCKGCRKTFYQEALAAEAAA